MPRKNFYSKYIKTIQIRQIISGMFNTKSLLTILLVVLVVGSQQVGVAPCPLQYQIGSIHSTRITFAQQRSVIPYVKGQDVQCYNYTLPYPFANIPQTAIAIHDFEAQMSDDIFFSVKPIKAQSLSFIPLLVRTYWKYTEWKKISFTLFVEDKSEFESGYYQVDTGSLGGCEPGKTIQTLLPFRSISQVSKLHHNVFLHGFEISSQLYSAQSKSPFEIQIVDSVTNSSGIAIFFSVTTITQVHSIHISYIAWETTNIDIVTGKYVQNIDNLIEISHTPISRVGRNYARIFGITGFIINNKGQEITFSTNWSGTMFNFILDASTPFIKYLSFEYLFFLGSECSDCVDYPLIFEGTCRKFCPQGYHATGEQVCIDCGAGHYWNGTACVKECPKDQFLNTLTNECECPPGLHWNERNCISCIGGKIFNKERNVCQCPSGTRWNGFGCATAQVCKNGQEWNVFKFMCECPNNSFWNGTYCVKIITCKNGKVSDGKNGCVCPAGTHWNGEWCEAHGCADGQSWNGSACACQDGYNFNGSMCLLCINGQVWNPSSRSCVCPGGFQWNGNFCKKVMVCSGNRVYNETVQQCLCPAKHFWNGYSCMVQPDCCCGKVWNETSFQCNCPDNFNWDGRSCLLCMNGKVWDENKSQCLCRAGTKWNGHFCVVIQECFGGMMWNQNTWSCECPAIMVWNGRYCISNPCIGGQIWDHLKRKCQCPDGYKFIDNLCQRPEVLCKSSRIWDSQLMKCVCPPGFYDNQIDCVAIPTCEGDKMLNPMINRCVCKPGFIFLELQNKCADPTCPENQRWNGNGCIDISCPPNSYYNGTQCICPDPRDKCLPWEYFDGISCVYQPGSCPQGTTWNGTYCVSNSVCPPGFYGLANQCLPLPQRCVPPTIYSSGRCMSSGTCPQGSYFSRGSCMPYVPCANGQTWSDSMVNCVCPEGTEWNGNRCLACSNGKTWQPFEGCKCPTGSFFSGSVCQRVDQGRCLLIPNSFWDGVQCVCHEGFEVVGMQCVCEGVVMGNRCDKCAHRPNSEWRYGSCRCKSGYNLINTECLANQIGTNVPSDCNVGTFYDSQQKMCLPCSAGCLTCQSSYSCIQCRPEFNYDAGSQLCTEQCGDGKKFILECDDGNNVDGDGCSFDCMIESGYVCRGGSPNSIDNCILYLPSQLTIQQTGQIRYSSMIIINLKLDYMPKSLLQSSDCNDRCSNILDGKLVAGDMDAVSIRSVYLAGTSFSFSFEIEFGRSYIGSFTLEVGVSPSIAQKYFGNVDTSDKLRVEVNPAFLSKVSDRQSLD